MSLSPRHTCPVCDGALVRGPAKCRCPLPERDDIPVLTRVNDEWVIEPLSEIKRTGTGGWL